MEDLFGDEPVTFRVSSYGAPTLALETHALKASDRFDAGGAAAPSDEPWSAAAAARRALSRPEDVDLDMEDPPHDKGYGGAAADGDDADVAPVELDDGRGAQLASVAFETNPADLHDPASAHGPPLVLVVPSGDDPGLVVPGAINSALRDYQREGVQFLGRLYAAKHGGVLGDDMGLGKTAQAIALLAAVFGKQGGLCDSVAPLPRWDGVGKRPTLALIVMPMTLLANWAAELATWARFRVVIAHGRGLSAALDAATERRAEIVLTTYDMIREHTAQFVAIHPTLTIADEVHVIKNSRSRIHGAMSQLPRRRRFGLTGTPMPNNHFELRALVNWAHEGSLWDLATFKNQYVKPIQLGGAKDATELAQGKARLQAERLQEQLAKHFLRRTKTDKLMAQLPSKKDLVVFCSLAPIQERAYRRLLASPIYQLMVRAEEPCDCKSGLKSSRCCGRAPSAPSAMWDAYHPHGGERCPFCVLLPCLTHIQKVCNHIELCKADPNERDASVAALQKCKAEMTLGEDAAQVGGIYAHDRYEYLSGDLFCGKLKCLGELLKEFYAEGVLEPSKVLLFSYSTRMLDILQAYVERKGYVYVRLDGKTPQGDRQTLVNDFNRNPFTFIFLISTKAGGTGINLVSANRVIIFDPNWNPAMDSQAMDRAFRLGQKRDVNVYRLLTSGTLEELVYNRQIYKEQAANRVLGLAAETRYFTAVQGVDRASRVAGELFGVTNLFKLATEEVETRSRIRQASDALYVIRPAHAGLGDDGDGGGDDDSETSTTSSDDEDGAPAPPPRGGSPDLLLDAPDRGVLYCHQHDAVVGGRAAVAAKERAAKRAYRRVEDAAHLQAAALAILRGQDLPAHPDEPSVPPPPGRPASRSPSPPRGASKQSNVPTAAAALPEAIDPAAAEEAAKRVAPAVLALSKALGYPGGAVALAQFIATATDGQLAELRAKFNALTVGAAAADDVIFIDE